MPFTAIALGGHNAGRDDAVAQWLHAWATIDFGEAGIGTEGGGQATKCSSPSLFAAPRAPTTEEEMSTTNGSQRFIHSKSGADVVKPLPARNDSVNGWALSASTTGPDGY
jgi:hypothetical protein